jgi:hypothetical protein
MNAHRVEAILEQDGTLILKDLPFRAGEKIEVVLRPMTPAVNSNGPYPLTRKPAQDVEPNEEVETEEWNALP